MPPPTAISCPRCGYDLSGVKTPGAEGGICSECGLAFLWNDLTSGRLHPPRFSYEHGSAWSVTRFARTLGRAMTGWRLWRRLQMIHDIKPGRLITFAILAALLMHGCAAVMVIGASATGRLGGWMPLSLTRASAAWRPSRMSTAWGPTPTTVPWTLYTTSTGWGGLWPVTIEDIVLMCAWPYRAEVQLPIPTLGETRIWLDGATIVGCAVVQAGPVAVLLMLQQTRRKFRLRKAHVMRAACLVVPLVPVVYFISQAVVRFASAATGISLYGNYHRDGLAVIALATCGVLSTLWWWSFTGPYLKVPHALGVALAGVVMGMATGLLAGLVVGSDVLYDVVG